MNSCPECVHITKQARPSVLRNVDRHQLAKSAHLYFVDAEKSNTDPEVIFVALFSYFFIIPFLFQISQLIMPPKKKGRTTSKKVVLTPEEQETRDQVDLFLKEYDMNREQTVKDAWRDVETISASINTMYKLELMKLPQEVKNMKWDDFFQQALDNGRTL